MSAELQYFNRTNTGLSTYYVLLFNGSSVANGGGLTNIENSWTNTVVRDNAIQLIDTNHVGIYFADFLEGVPAGTYVPVVFQAGSGVPSSTATTTDAFIERLPAIQWTGDAQGGALSSTETDILARIDSNAALLSAGGFYVTSRVANSNLVIWQGETWDNSAGTAEPITKGAGETWPTDLTGYTITSTITKTAANTNAGTLSTLVMPCTVTQATGASQSFYIQTGSTTANLAIGDGTRGYDWHVEAFNGTVRATLRAGVASVKKRL